MRWIPAFLILFGTVVVGSFMLDEYARRDVDGVANAQAASVDASATPTPLRSMRPESPLRPPVDKWTTYISDSGGYTLDFPLGWVVNESSHYGGAASIVPPVRKRADTIGVRYFDYEKPEEDDLLDWYERYFEIQWSPYRAVYQYEEVVLGDQEQSGGRRALYGYIPDTPYGRVYILTNGRMVLEIATNGASEQQEQVLRRIAESIEFHSDAPSSMLDISDPANPPSITTVEEYERQREIKNDALSALGVRIQTGETPHELLTDPGVAAEYKDLLKHTARDIELRDESRAMAERLTAEPLPTAEPTSFALTKEAVEVMERRYNEQLEREATLEASITVQPTSPIIPTPAPTSTPIPDSLLEGTADQFPGLQPYIRTSQYGADHGAMLVWYDPDIWDSKLINRGGALELLDDPECRLYLYTGSFEAFPMSAEWMANREWTVFEHGPNYVGYISNEEGVPFQADIEFPEGQHYRETNKSRCQLLVEDVLDTASAVPAELIE